MIQFGLTKRQREALDFIRAYSAERGVSPTFGEIASYMGKGKSDIFRILTGLEERGAIRRMRNRARSIELVDRPAPVVGQFTLPPDMLRRLLHFSRRLGMSADDVLAFFVDEALRARESRSVASLTTPDR